MSKRSTRKEKDQILKLSDYPNEKDFEISCGVDSFKEINGKIYILINNINGKFYIGQTRNSLYKRFQNHSTSKRCPIIHNAIRKYGKENFTILQIDQANNVNELNKKEEAWINQMQPHYNIIKNGTSFYYSENILKTITNERRNRNVNNNKKTSKYKGVFWDKSKQSWSSKITVNNKTIFLGRYNNEEEAGLAYNGGVIKYWNGEGVLNNIKGEPIFYKPYSNKYLRTNFKNKTLSSKYRGVYYSKYHKRWIVELYHNNKKYRIGSFKNEDEGALAYNNFIVENNIQKKFLNII